MSLLFFLGGRHDKKAWMRTLSQAGANVMEKADSETLAKITDQLIASDCGAIEECANIMMKSPDKELRNQRRLVLFSRYNHLLKLEPYASGEQKELIKKAKELTTKARKYR